jgi:hypothetical protein
VRELEDAEDPSGIYGGREEALKIFLRISENATCLKKFFNRFGFNNSLGLF